MKINQSKLKMILFFFVATVGFLLINSSSAFATARTWTGAAGDKKLATSGNWSPSGSPETGDVLTISHAVLFSASCTTDIALDNDIVAANVTLAGINFTGTRPADCYQNAKITGNEVKTSGDITSTAFAPVFEVQVTAAASITLAQIHGSGLLSLGSNTVTLTKGTTFQSVSGTGGLVLGENLGRGGGGCGDGTGTSSPILGDGSAFSGTITSNEAALTVSPRSNDIARHASSITINANGRLSLYLNKDQDMSLNTSLTLNGGTVAAYQANLFTSGNCIDATSNKTATLAGNVAVTQNTNFSPQRVNIKFTGSVTGQDKIKLTSGVTGTITLPDGLAQVSQLAIKEFNDPSDCDYLSSGAPNNKDIVNTDCSDRMTYPTSIQGILAGTGKIGSGITILEGGVIAPGNSPGTLSVGDLEFEEGGVYEFEIAGNEPGQYDQINVTGTVKLGDGTLRVLPLDGFVPKNGQSFVIVNNDGEDAVEGTFAGLEEGATVEVDGKAWFTISYKGGDGNDVVLTAIPGVAETGEIKSGSPIGVAIAAGAAGVLAVSVKLRKFATRRR
jgi:hypothetical protein